MTLDSYRHKGLRNALVNELVAKGIKNKEVLKAIGTVPRHIFFDDAFIQHSYQDKAFPIGCGQTISQPYTVAFQSELLDVQPKQKVLEIGTGSGYQSCVLLELGVKLFTIERHQELFDKTKKTLTTLRYRPKFFCGDGTKGLPSFAPFDRIIVTAGAPAIPSDLLDQLSLGGKIVIPVGDGKNQEMQLLTKVSSTKVTKETFGQFSFVPLIGQQGWKQ